MEIIKKIENNLETLLIDADRAASLLNIGKTLFYRLKSEAKLPKETNLGRRVLWSLEELKMWVKAGSPDQDRWENIKKNLLK